MNGTIYWDESSRGYHQNEGRTPYTRGRWVGEKMVNGRRVRMRSSDYNKVLQWLRGNKLPDNLIRLKDFPSYSIDIENRVVYNKQGKKMKYSEQNGQERYQLHRDNLVYCVSFNRIAYAALHDIELQKIPSDIVVSYSDGEYRLQYHTDVVSDAMKQLRQQNLTRINNILAKRHRETEILQRFYKTGDQTELVSYCSKDIFETLIAHSMKLNHCTIQRATDIVIQATESFLRRIVNREVPYISISPAIISECRQVSKAKRKYHPLNNNYDYERE
jgi:hypothetical protein